MTVPPRAVPVRRPRPGAPGRTRASVARALLATLVVAVPAAAPAGDRAEPRTLGHRGYLVIAGAAADTSGAFRWQDGPGPGQRSLVWEDGLLVVPDGLALESFGPRDLAVPCGPDLSGSSHDGQLVFRPGTYAVEAPLVLSDGTISLHVTAGTLGLEGTRVRYRPPAPTPATGSDPRAPYLLLAGLVVLTVTLMRRARRGAGRP